VSKGQEPPALKLRNEDTGDVWYVRPQRAPWLMRLAAWLSRSSDDLPEWTFTIPDGSWVFAEDVQFDQLTMIKGQP
jgi:hypothetical protein